ncbi:mercury resistance system transport protein MerF [Herbaspirillum sp. VT-16-41]|uniref:mercury resistance system transport protein MerF n=1 Tax=Herbaspirillum sp. VT-16-41 TaxID=1953765 RepID=UPI000981092E
MGGAALNGYLDYVWMPALLIFLELIAYRQLFLGDCKILLESVPSSVHIINLFSQQK